MFFSRKIDTGGDGWPIVKETFGNQLILSGKNYLTPRRALFGRKVFHIVFWISLIWITYTGFMSMNAEGDAVLGWIALGSPAPLVAFATRPNNRESLSKGFFGKSLFIKLNNKELVIKGGLKRQQRIKIQPGWPIKISLQPHPDMGFVEADAASATTRDGIKKARTKAAIFQNSFILILATGTAVVRICEVYSVIDAQRLSNALGMMMEIKTQQAQSAVQQAVPTE